MTVQDAVEKTVALAKERGLPPSRIADEVASTVNGTQGDELKRQGLIYLANNRLHSGRNGGRDYSPERERDTADPVSGRSPQPGYPHPADANGWDPLTEITLQTADGDRIAPLANLKVDDLSAAADRFAAQINGMRRKRDFLFEAANACENHGVDKIADLPDEERDTLRYEAMEAWS